MIEILAIIWVVRLFSRTASEKGLNKVLWGFIGALSYYVPLLTFSFLVAPSIVQNIADNTASSVGMITMLVILMNIVVGIICCTIAYQFLKRMKPAVIDDVNIIDSNLQ